MHAPSSNMSYFLHLQFTIATTKDKKMFFHFLLFLITFSFSFPRFVCCVSHIFTSWEQKNVTDMKLHSKSPSLSLYKIYNPATPAYKDSLLGLQRAVGCCHRRCCTIDSTKLVRRSVMKTAWNLIEFTDRSPVSRLLAMV